MGESWTAINVEQLLAQLGWVRRLARSLVEDEAGADDLVQETLLAAGRATRRPADLRAWLTGTLSKLHLYRARSDRRRRKREAAVARPEAVPSSRDVAEAAEACELLVHTVRCLDEPFGTAVLLRYYSNLTPTQIANREGITPEAARARVRKGMALMRQRLDHEYGDRRAWCVALLPLFAMRPHAAPGLGLLASAKAKLLVAALVVLPLALVGALLIGHEDPAPPPPALATRAPRERVDATPSAQRPAEPNPAPTGKAAVATRNEPVPLSQPLAHTLSGRVVDPWGNPLGGIFIRAKNEETGKVLWARADERGAFSLSDLPDGTYALAVRTTRDASQEGWSRYYAERGLALPRVKGVCSGSGEQVLRVEFASALAGVLIDAQTGRPLDIAVLPNLDGAIDLPGLKPIQGRFVAFFARARPVRFTLHPVPRTGYAPSPATEQQLVEGLIHRDLVVALKPGGTLTGTIRHAQGKPLTKVEICARDPNDGRVLATSPPGRDFAATGAYRLPGLPSGEVSLDVIPLGCPSFRLWVSVAAGTETRRDIVVRDGGWLVVRFQDRSGRPVNGCRVSIRSLASPEELTDSPSQSADSSAFLITANPTGPTPLLPGHYCAELTKGGRSEPCVFTVQESKRTEITMQVDLQRE